MNPLIKKVLADLDVLPYPEWNYHTFIPSLRISPCGKYALHYSGSVHNLSIKQEFRDLIAEKISQQNFAKMEKDQKEKVHKVLSDMGLDYETVKDCLNI